MIAASEVLEKYRKEIEQKAERLKLPSLLEYIKEEIDPAIKILRRAGY